MLNWGSALIALDIGQKLRYNGTPVILTSVSVAKKAEYTSDGITTSGDRYISATFIALSGKHYTQTVRLENLVTEEEYLESIKKGKKDESTNEARRTDQADGTF